MSADLDRLTAVLDDAGLDTGLLTLVLAAGVTAAELAAALGLGQAEGDATAYGVAVARSNLQAYVRFGFARDGEIGLDSDEYASVDSLDDLPVDVRDLAALARDDAGGDVDPFVVAPSLVHDPDA